MSLLGIFCEIISFLYFDTPLGNIPGISNILNALGEQFCSAEEM